MLAWLSPRYGPFSLVNCYSWAELLQPILIREDSEKFLRIERRTYSFIQELKLLCTYYSNSINLLLSSYYVLDRMSLEPNT